LIGNTHQYNEFWQKQARYGSRIIAIANRSKSIAEYCGSVSPGVRFVG
jgi:hypothetical protein